MQKLKNNIKFFNNILKKLITDKFNVKSSDIDNFVYLSKKHKIPTGNMYNEKYLKYFSTKLFEIYSNLNNNIFDKNGIGTSFIYSNLVEIGIKFI